MNKYWHIFALDIKSGKEIEVGTGKYKSKEEAQLAYKDLANSLDHKISNPKYKCFSLFLELKELCKTSSQRRAFNELIKTFVAKVSLDWLDDNKLDKNGKKFMKFLDPKVKVDLFMNNLFSLGNISFKLPSKDGKSWKEVTINPEREYLNVRKVPEGNIKYDQIGFYIQKTEKGKWGWYLWSGFQDIASMENIIQLLESDPVEMY